MVKVVLLACFVALCAASPLYDTGKISYDNGRIVGGDPIDISQVRHQVSLRDGGYHICGGSIISANFILTAAHCVAGGRPEYYTVRIGSSFNNRDGEIIQVQEIISHPKYDYWELDFDYALLRLDREIVFSDSQGPIRLVVNDPEDDAEAIVSGWGETQASGDRSVLRAALVHIVNQGECDDAYGGITPRMICAGEPQGGKDSCQGDSGGPLVADGHLIGIVSWGAGCALPGYPGVYSRVSAAREWIAENTR